MTMLSDLVAGAADPVNAALVVERLRGAGQPVSPRLEHDELMARAVVALADASRSLADAVVRTPPLLVVVDHLVERDAVELVPEARAAVMDHPRPTEELRRWKRREFLRIALRDLLGLSDLAGVGRELASLADACLGAALAVAGPTQPMAVIGMGKLGGQELNYASDVDVIFVHEGDGFSAAKVARRLVATMSEVGPEGIVFRTDADLRPGGRAGPLSSTVAACRAHYTERALTWERQALIKARGVTGDTALARAWFDAVLPEVWDRPVPADAVRDVRAMKARSEQLLAREGLTEREVKRGRGGIRDVEMAVQLLQLVHGGRDPGIRSPTTLKALDQLARHGYVDDADAEHLATAYRYLRTVEHRLQLEREQQVYALPADGAALDRLARVLGYRDRAGTTALEQFVASHERHQASVRGIHERLFFRPLLEALGGGRSLGTEALGDELAALGFGDVVAARSAVEELTTGTGRSAVQLRLLFPYLLEWLSSSPNPDLGLLQLRTVLDGPVRAMTVVPLLRESDVIGQRLCRLLGSSKLAGQLLRRHAHLVSGLADDRLAATRPDREALMAEAVAELAPAPPEAPTDPDGGVRGFKRRHELAVAARDLLRPVEGGGGRSAEGQETAAVGTGVGEELSDVADAALEGVVAALAPSFPFTVVGMGKLGGRELSYASDLDVIFVHDGPQAPAEAVATAVLAELGALTSDGRAWEIDARLRPEGSQGVLARSLDSYREYHGRWALVWERQALIRARACAGDVELGRRYIELRNQVTYPRPPTEEEVAEIRRIKRRVERERLPARTDPTRHVKLGPGGLVDVEFTVQLLQLRHGVDDESLRHPGTLAALRALQHAGLVDADDATVLRAAYVWCDQVRNVLYLRTAAAGDVVPDADPLRRDIARLLAISDPVAVHAQHTVAARAVVERLFYGDGAVP